MPARDCIAMLAWPLLATLAVACTPDFQAPRDVTDLRVLAIRQEVPDPNGTATFADAFIDLSTQQVQSATIRMLVVDPQPRAALVVNAQVCSPTDSGRCDDVPSLDLGSPPSSSPGLMEQQPRYELRIPPEAVAAALQDDKLKGFGGVRVQFSMQAADGDPHGPALASKLLLYTTASDAMRNHNPDIASLEVTRDGQHVATIGRGGTLSVPSGEYGIRPVLGPGGSGIEEYDTTDLAGNTVHLREKPRYSFFSTPPVSFDRDVADEPLPDQPQPTNGLARLTATGSGGVVWVVVRDGRGGIDWISVQCVVSG